MNLLKRTITGLIFITVVILSFFLPAPYAFLLFLFFTLVGTHEFVKMSENTPARPLYALTMLISAVAYALFALFAFCSTADARISNLLITITLLVLLVLVTFSIELFRKKENPILNIATTILPLFWIAMPLGIVVLWAHSLADPITVLSTFILVWAYDTFAYCGGSLFGKHRLFERISPKKSWEGALISFVLTSATAICFSFLPFFQCVFFNTWQWLFFSWVVIIFSTFGDLVESLFKRSCKIKDSGNILPGHGGILDRFDSLFFTIPAAFIFWIFVNLNF